MRTRVRKLGSSLLVRIPRSLAEEIGLCENLTVDLSIQGHKLVIQPRREERLRLDELLRGVTEENLHGEWDTGPAVGKEVW